MRLVGVRKSVNKDNTVRLTLLYGSRGGRPVPGPQVTCRPENIPDELDALLREASMQGYPIRLEDKNVS